MAAAILEKEHVPAPDRWGEVFGDDTVATAMSDRLVHHAAVTLAEGRQLPHARPRPRTGSRCQHR
ncbi:ATP-binding protein [Streptomyces bobili]|uniref:ATP-binding protein n=1 Tax=Streptomyces bobili TaxID=67280 RepID=UPI0036F580F2